MRIRQTLSFTLCLFFLATGFAHAALVTAADNYGIPASRILTVEAFGVLDNDTLDGQNAGDSGVTATLLTDVSKGTLSCPGVGPGLCADGSFEYTPGTDFDGTDSFVYQAESVSTSETSPPTTVTLTACTGGPTVFTCWLEASYLAKLSALGYNNNVFVESFEGTVWDVARSPAAATSIESKGIIWTSNHPATNFITTGTGPARTGMWGGYDPDHGYATGTPTECDINNPPVTCLPYDGLSGSILPGGDTLIAVGGYISGITGANIAILLDDVPHGIGKTGAGHRFFGVIDTAGFSGFEFRELDGKIGQQLFIWGDDFIIASSGTIAANNAPVLTPAGDQATDENIQLNIMLNATDPDDGDIMSFSMSDGPVGATLNDNGDGTANFIWRPDYSQAGSYSVTFTVTDNAIPAAAASETITITVNDVNRPPVLSAIGNKTADINTELSFQLSASDSDGNSLSFVKSGGPAAASLLDNGDGTATFSWTPNVGEAGDHTVTFTVSDNGVPVASDLETITISVIDPFVDVTPPQVQINSPANGAALTSASVTVSGTASDDTALAGVIVNGVAATVVGGNFSADVTLAEGVNSITAIATDASSNSTSSSIQVSYAPPDVTPPVITLLGNDPVSIEAGSTYTDAGATASDNLDGDISGSIAVTGSVNTGLVGAYILTYNVSDAAGNPAVAVTRTVNVTADVTPPVITLLGNDPASIEAGSTYTDAGASAADNLDGDISGSIAVTGSVNTGLVGTYILTYNVSDAAGNPAVAVTRTVNVTAAPNNAPVADAGPDQTVLVNVTVTLDGSGSTDIDGDMLDFSWLLTSPAGSAATLSDPAAIKPTFYVDLPGTYTVQLVVNDGALDSAADSVLISTTNSAPVANAGPDQTSLVGSNVTLDGSSSSDIDGDALTFSWSLTTPPGSVASLSDPTAIKPIFNIDIPGTYTAQLVVNDGALGSAADSVIISTINSAPIADAGPDQTALVGNSVVLDGSSSSDVDGDALTFSWSLTTPAGSTTTLSDPSAVNPGFMIDVAGTYVAQLVVNDGSEDSAADTVSISTSNSAPVADAGPDQTAMVGDTVTLDGIGSSDVDGDALTFSWSLTAPAGSAASLSDATTINPVFVIDLPGIYVGQLIVNDGSVSSVADTVTISTTNSAPVADAGIDYAVLVNEIVMLDGSGSSDADGDALTFSWSFTSVPAGSVAVLSDVSAVSPGFDVDLPGIYVVQLIVNDGSEDSVADAVSITASSGVPGSLQFSRERYKVNEGVGSAIITVTRSGGSAGAVSVDYSTGDDTARAGSDYTAVSGTLNFAAGVTSQSFKITILQDTKTENNELLTIKLGNPDGGAALGLTASATVVIADDDTQTDVAATGGSSSGSIDVITLMLLFSLYLRNFRKKNIYRY